MQEDGMTEGRFFLFCMEESMERILDVLGQQFGVDGREMGNPLELSNRDVVLRAQIASFDMGQEEKDFIREQQGRTRGRFYEVETSHADVRTNLMYQLEATKSFVTVDYAFQDEGEDENAAKRAWVENFFFEALPALRGILLTQGETDGFYIFDAAKRERTLLLDTAGESGTEKFIPYSVGRMEPGDGVSMEQLGRRERSRRLFEERGIYVPAFYPVIESEEESSCRGTVEIAERMVALAAVSLFSEALLGDKMPWAEAYNFIKTRIIDEFGAETFFSPREWAYINNPESKEQERISFSWQYEGLHVMEWALGFAEAGEEDGSLDFPDHVCDVPLAVRILNRHRSIGEIVAASRPKTPAELLDACDLTFCLDWACVDTRIRSLPAPAGMNGGVVMERHKALNWLVGADERAGWDEVGTDT